jgi:hypothetical protein
MGISLQGQRGLQFNQLFMIHGIVVGKTDLLFQLLLIIVMTNSKSWTKKGKYKYILDLIEKATLQLSDEYKWDKSVFENAYKEVIENDFTFKIDYPRKMYRDKKKSANMIIEKNEIVTSIYLNIPVDDSKFKVKLLDKKNVWWYDCVYQLAKKTKWFDSDRFGVSLRKEKINMSYSIKEKTVSLFENGNPVSEIDFKKYFLFG